MFPSTSSRDFRWSQRTKGKPPELVALTAAKLDLSLCPAHRLPVLTWLPPCLPSLFTHRASKPTSSSTYKLTFPRTGSLSTSCFCHTCPSVQCVCTSGHSIYYCFYSKTESCMKTNFIFKISIKCRLLKAKKKLFLSNTIYFNCLNETVKCATARTSGASMSPILCKLQNVLSTYPS